MNTHPLLKKAAAVLLAVTLCANLGVSAFAAEKLNTSGASDDPTSLQKTDSSDSLSEGTSKPDSTEENNSGSAPEQGDEEAPAGEDAENQGDDPEASGTEISPTNATEINDLDELISKMQNATQNETFILGPNFATSMALKGTVAATLTHGFDLTIDGSRAGPLTAADGQLHFAIDNPGMSRLTFKDLAFTGNSTDGSGGFMLSDGTATFENCSCTGILTNPAIQATSNSTTLNIRDSKFTDNGDSALFGGIFISYGVYTYVNTSAVCYCLQTCLFCPCSE
jgi:hypothetical protein